MLTLELLLALQEGQPSDSLDGPLAAEADRLVSALPGRPRMRVLHNISHHRDSAIAAGEPLERLDGFVETGLVPHSTKVQITSFDAALEVSVPDSVGPERMIEAARGLSTRLGNVIAPERSAVALGNDYSIMEGNGPVQLLVCLRRVPSLTHEEFCDFWLNELVKHTKQTPGKCAYRQVHANPELSALAASAAGVLIDDVDGVALEFYPSLPLLYSAVDWADRPNAAVIQAETKMIDFGRGAILAYAPSA